MESQGGTTTGCINTLSVDGAGVIGSSHPPGRDISRLLPCVVTMRPEKKKQFLKILDVECYSKVTFLRCGADPPKISREGLARLGSWSPASTET